MEFLSALWKFLLITAPYLLLGLAVAGLMKACLSLEMIEKNLGGGMKAVWKAALLGIPLPLCSCSVLPAAVALKRSGASNGAVSSFLISTPETGLDSITLTYGLMGPWMAILRPLCALITAVLAGLGQNIWNPLTIIGEVSTPSPCCCHCAKQQAVPKDLAADTCCTAHVAEAESSSCCCGHHQSSCFSRWAKTAIGRLGEGMGYAFGTLIRDMAGWLALGIIAGAAIDYFFPTDLLTNMNGILGKLVVMALAIPLYICASSSTPVAASLILKGMSPGTALLFLLLGPATNISNLLVMRKYIGTKGIVINLATIVGVGLVTSTLVDYFAGAQVLKAMPQLHEHGHHGLATVCAVILILLLAQKPICAWWKKGHACCH